MNILRWFGLIVGILITMVGAILVAPGALIFLLGWRICERLDQDSVWADDSGDGFWRKGVTLGVIPRGR